MINKLCEAEVRKNIVLAETGGKLTMPLSVLKRDCNFKKKWDKAQDKWHGLRCKKYSRKWRAENKDKVKEYNKEYYQKQKKKALELK